MNLFQEFDLDNGLHSPGEVHHPSRTAIECIDRYLSGVGHPAAKNIMSEWHRYGSTEKLSAHIAHKFIIDHISDEGLLYLGKDNSMIDMYNCIKDIIESVLNDIYECLLSRSSGRTIDQNSSLDWNEKEFLPLVVKQLLLQLADWNEYEERVSFARFQAWYNCKISRMYLTEGESGLDSETKFRDIELESPGHKLLCDRLQDMGYMFFLEAPCVLLGDKKKLPRRVDLIVVSNNRAVIVEVDGGTHRTPEQQRDDYERDRLIRRNWTNTLRLEHSDVLYNTEECIQKIISSLDPTRGVIS